MGSGWQESTVLLCRTGAVSCVGRVVHGQRNTWAEEHVDGVAGGVVRLLPYARSWVVGVWAAGAEAHYAQPSSKRRYTMGRFRWWTRVGVAPLGALLALVLGASVAFADSAHFIK